MIQQNTFCENACQSHKRAFNSEAIRGMEVFRGDKTGRIQWVWISMP